MLWRLTLVEHHPVVSPQAADATFGLYYFDWTDPSGLVTSRQENNVAFAEWRWNATDGVDLPWNVFYAFQGQVAATYVDQSTGDTQCRRLPFNYTRDFWNQNFLTSNCSAVTGEAEPMPDRFGGDFFDGREAVARACVIDGGAMAIRPTIWTDPSTGQVLRFDLQKASPGWNAQTWDILQQVDYSQLDQAFLAPPAWC